MRRKLFEGARALVVILGVHGGGVANAKWLLKQGAKVTVTDERDRRALAASLKKFSPNERRKIHFVLGGQRKNDFHNADLILFGPGVHQDSPWLKYARTLGKHIVNDASLFLRYCKNPTIAVTGTRGKTTTTEWIAWLLTKKYPQVRASGNTPENALLAEIGRIRGKRIPAVLELSSWQLELAPASGRAPHIAAITNIHPDHLNTYRNINEYADAKANICCDQEPHDALILNRDNKWWKYFAQKNPRSQLFFVSKKKLPQGVRGVSVDHGVLYYKEGKKPARLVDVRRFIRERGEHNLENLLVAVLAAKLFDSGLPITEKDILALPTPRMRQEVIYKGGGLAIVNDSASTSPDGTIAAINRFSGDALGFDIKHSQRSNLKTRLILISGGTDKKLEFKELARSIKRYITPERLILLEGSGTEKLLKEIKSQKLKTKTFQTLEECVAEAFRIARNQGSTFSISKGRTRSRETIILFSPGAASFEKFMHEFDRGERFNALVRQQLKTKKSLGVVADRVTGLP